MNNERRYFVRKDIKKGLAQLSESSHLLFKRLYSHKNLELPINDVVDSMPDDKLEWAMQQVERTLTKLAREKEALETY